MDKQLQEVFEMLGKVAKDKVTGFEGVVESVCFDLYGCVQVCLKPSGVDKEGKIKDAYWFDVNRMKVVNGGIRKMQPPEHFHLLVSEKKKSAKRPGLIDQGPARPNKPTPDKAKG